VNKLGTVPLLLGASEEVKAAYLAPVARGEAMFSYALSEPEAGSDAVAMKTRAGALGRRLRAERREALDYQRRGLEVLHGDGRHRPGRGARTGSRAFVLEDGDPGFTFGAPEHKLGIKGLADQGAVLRRLARSRPRRLVGDEGEGFKIALRTLDHTRITIAAQALGIAQGRPWDYALGYVPRTQAVRPRDLPSSRACSS